MSQKQLFVGIDVANLKVDVAFLDADARPVRPPSTFDNDPDGWIALRAAIVAASNLVGKRVGVVCGMESTGNMHKRLEQALRKEKRRKLEVHVLNPRAVKNFSRALLNSARTDRIDAHTIALFLMRMKPVATEGAPDLFEEFREATRMRRSMIEERTDTKNRFHKLLRYHFPGYRKLLGTTLSKSVFVAIAAFPSPHLILEAGQGEIAALRIGKIRSVGQPLEDKLRALAAQAPNEELPSLTQLLLKTTARRILDISVLIDEMDDGIAAMLEQLFPGQVLTSIPGLGHVSAASILAEICDISRFQNKTDFIGYCGLYPVVWESGEMKRRYRMTTKGNRMLKMTLLVASAAARQYNPTIASFYERLRARGKSTKAAGGAIARKLAEIVFAVLTRNEPWNAEKAMRGIEKSCAMSKTVKTP